MNYKELLKNIIDELGVENTSSNDIRRFNTYIKFVLNEMFGEAELLKKVIRYKVTSTEDSTEDFADSTLISGFTVDTGIVIEDGKAKAATNGLAIHIANLKYPQTINIVGGGTAGTLPPASDRQITVTLYNYFGTVLNTETITITPTALTFDYDFVIPSRWDAHNGSIVITMNPAGDVLEEYANLYISEITITDYNHYIDLPTDFFVPLETRFRNTSNAEMMIMEVSSETFMNWMNPPVTSDTQDVYDFTTTPITVTATIENETLDGRIAYFFESLETGYMRIMWKDVFDGIIELNYSYIPVPTFAEADAVPVYEVFIECLLHGVIVRGLKRKLQLGKLTEIELQSTRDALRLNMSEYQKKLASYRGRNKRESETTFVIPNLFMNWTE